jgi:hypothetical protein
MAAVLKALISGFKPHLKGTTGSGSFQDAIPGTRQKPAIIVMGLYKELINQLTFCTESKSLLL